MLIHEKDNVTVDPKTGQKTARYYIKKGEPIIKYGCPIGIATADIKVGESVHTHNLRSAITGTGAWEYHPAEIKTPSVDDLPTHFEGYLRVDGSVGIRNEIWLIPTVGCANCTAKVLAEKCGGKALTHQFGCSQLGGDLEMTRKLLCGLAKNPNTGGVLIIGLGCEENTLASMKAELGESERIKYLNLQDCEDEIAEGLSLIDELKNVMKNDRRQKLPISKLRIGVKCGGSDGYSGITANPLVGRTMESFAALGSTILMTEIPECFGAEDVLLSHCADKKAFDEVSSMISDFRKYYIDHGEGISDNPSPGNIAGGISTLEEKSLGCVQKGGHVRVLGGLPCGGQVPELLIDTQVAGDARHCASACQPGGLWMVNGPGNDLIAVTNLAASGAVLILFTTGRGTPLCAPVPTLKLSTNSGLAAKKPHWIDFNAGNLLDGMTTEDMSRALFSLCLDTCNGEETIGERHGYYDIAIWKNGVTL